MTTGARVEPGEGYKCFATWHVFLDDTFVGAVQCRGPCYGITADLGHKHGPYIAFVGPDRDNAKNLAGSSGGLMDAVERVLCAVRG